MTESDTDGVVLLREQQTMLMTLYLHAQDAESDHPVLADEFAGPILARIDHDAAAMRRLRGNQPLIVARAKAIDDSVRASPWVRRVAGWQPTFRQASTGFVSTTHDLDAATARHARFSTTATESLVTAAAHATSGGLAHFIGLIDRIPAGHRAMTLTVQQATG